MSFKNYTRNPWDNTHVSPYLVDERHIVAAFNPDLGSPPYYGVRLQDAPVKNSAPPLEIWTCTALSGTLVQVLKLTEIFSGPPGPDQFIIDYGETDAGFASGMVWINVAPGTFISASYRSRGTIFSVENIVSLIAGQIAPAGLVAAYSGIALPPGWIWADRASYPRVGDPRSTLYPVYTTNLGTVIIASGSPALLTRVAHELPTGANIELTTTGILPVGLVAYTNYFVIRLTADTFRLALTRKNARAGIAINTTGSGPGVHSLRFCPWGTNGAANFHVPDSRGIAFVGDGSTDRTGANDGLDATGAFYTGHLGQYYEDGFHSHHHYVYSLQPRSTSDTGDGIQGVDLATGFTITGDNYWQARTPKTDGVHGTPRAGALTRPAQVGMKYIIKY